MLRLAIATATLTLTLGLLGCTGTTGAGGGKGPGTQDAHVIVCAPGSYMNGNECIPVNRSCPSGTTLQDGQCVAVAAEQPEKAPPATVAEGTSYEDVLDPRGKHRQPRSRQLLITELQGLEALYAAVPKDATDRPHLLWRLADGYVELAAAAVRDGLAAKDEETVTKTRKIERAAHTAAIKYYQLLAREYPKFCRAPSQSTGKSTGCNDEILYYLGLEYVRTEQIEQARKTFMQLIQGFPASAWIGHTYFQFGEMFRKEAVSDPSKWALAEQCYREATKYGAPIRAAAYDRLGDVYEAQGKAAEARAARAKAQAPAAPQP